MNRLEELEARYIVGRCMPDEHFEQLKITKLRDAFNVVDDDCREIITELAGLQAEYFEKIDAVFKKYPPLTKGEVIERGLLRVEGQQAVNPHAKSDGTNYGRD